MFCLRRFHYIYLRGVTGDKGGSLPPLTVFREGRESVLGLDWWSTCHNMAVHFVLLLFVFCLRTSVMGVIRQALAARVWCWSLNRLLQNVYHTCCVCGFSIWSIQVNPIISSTTLICISVFLYIRRTF